MGFWPDAYKTDTFLDKKLALSQVKWGKVVKNLVAKSDFSYGHFAHLFGQNRSVFLFYSHRADSF